MQKKLGDDSIKKRMITLFLSVTTCLFFVGCSKRIASIQTNNVSTTEVSVTDRESYLDNILSEEIILLDKDEFRITANGFDASGEKGPEIDLLIENYTDSSILISGSYDRINGYSAPDSFHPVTLLPKEKTTGKITLDRSQLDYLDILGNIHFQSILNITDSGTNEVVFDSCPISLFLNLIPETDDSSEYILEKATIQEETLADTDLVKITAIDLNTDGSFGPELNIRIENKTSEPFSFDIDSGSINDYMVDMYCDAPLIMPGTTDTKILISSNTFKQCSITNIYRMDFSIRLTQSSPDSSFSCSYPASLKTNLPEAPDENLRTSGNVLYDTEELLIANTGIYKETPAGWGLLMYIENRTDKTITIQTKDVVINEKNSDAAINITLPPYKKTAADLTFLNSEIDTSDSDLATAKFRLFIRYPGFLETTSDYQIVF